jgi:hypothetical protein
MSLSGTLTNEDASLVIANVEHLAGKEFLTFGSNDEASPDGQMRTWKVVTYSKDFQTKESSYGVVFSDMPNEPPVMLGTQEIVSLLVESTEV